MRVVVAALCCIVLASCAAQRKSAAPQASQSEAGVNAGAASPLPETPRDQIIELDAKIAADLGQLQLAEPAQADFLTTSAQPMGAIPSAQDPKCKPAKNETCDTSCTLSDSICKNADHICRLAVEMNDDWARGRCAKANKSCEASKTKCCGCQ
ncbi:MAG TPA: hypothetical protein VIV11_02285 [Kofleriaceae bacterium]